jgi:hypothetical protein
LARPGIEHLVPTEFMVEKVKAAMATTGLDRLLEIERRTMRD